MRMHLSLLCSALLLSASARGQDRTPFPEFTGQRLIVAGVENSYEPLRDDIQRIEQASPQTYYVVVIASSGTGDRPTAGYADALYRAWAEQAPKKKLTFEADRSIMIVLAEKNRQLAVHAGGRLREELGLRPEIIDQQIVRPIFLPHAKAGNYRQGLQALLPAIDKWVAEKEAAARPKPQPIAKTEVAPVVKPVATAASIQQEAPVPVKAQEKSGAALWIGLAAVGVLGAIVGGAWLRQRGTRKRVTARFDDYKERVIQLRQRVEDARERHKLLPSRNPHYQRQMAGATLGIYNQVQGDMGQLWDTWLQRMETWDRVQSLIRTPRLLSVGPLHEAEQLLNQLGNFKEIDQSCQGCVQRLDQLEQAHEQAQDLLRKVEAQPEPLVTQMDVLRKLKLPVQPYETELGICVRLIGQARTDQPADPIGARLTLEEAQGKLQGLGRWMEEIANLFRRSQQLAAEHDAALHSVADHRKGGLLLTEPEGNPDPVLEQMDTQHHDALEALKRADAKAAAQALDQAFALGKKARDLMERQIAARALCAKELPIRRSEAQRLRQAVGDAQTPRNALEQHFARGSWQGVADNLVQARQIHGAADTLLDHAAAAESAQHYFRATDLLTQAYQQQSQVQLLVAGVAQCLQQLIALRETCGRRRQEISDLARQVQTFVATHPRVVRSPVRGRFDTAEAHWRQVRTQMDLGRPDWPTCQKQMEEVTNEYHAALKDAEDDVRRHQQLFARLNDAGRDAERIGLFLQQHHEDRPEANQLYQSAVAALSRLRQEGDAGRSDWGDLLRQVEAAAADLKKAEKQAQEDLRLSERASAEIASAEQELYRAQSYSARGITADWQSAENLLLQARETLLRQAYEQAIEQATKARQSARNAHDLAVQRVQQEEQREDQERRRREAQEAAAAAQAAAHSAALAASFGAPSAPSDPGPMTWPSAPEAPTSPMPEPPPIQVEAPYSPPPTESSQTSW